MVTHITLFPYSFYAMFCRLYITVELTHRLHDILKYGATISLNALCLFNYLISS